MKRKISILLIMTSIILLSCSTTIEAVRDPSFESIIDKMYIVLELGELSPGFKKHLIENIDATFLENNIITESYLVTGMELNQSELSAKIQNFNAPYLMVIKLTEATIGGMEMQFTGTYDIGIIARNNETRIWRAKVKIEVVDFGFGRQQANEMIEKIINQLSLDNMIVLTLN
jgi:hypothetical protein